MAKRMTTNEVLASIKAEGGFNNWRNWNTKELVEWVESNYDCTRYVARHVAKYIKNGYGL